MAVRFVAPTEDVNSDQCQFFFLFCFVLFFFFIYIYILRAVFNIYAGKEYSEYLLISFLE